MTNKLGVRLALAATALLLVTAGTAQAADKIRVTKPVDATKDDVDPLRTWAAPYLIVNPDNPKMILAGVHEFRDKKCGLMRSLDGGQTWKLVDTPTSDPSPKSYPFCLANNSNIFQAPIAWGRNNTVYLAMVGWDAQDTRNKASVVVAKSTDLGDSWTSVVVHDARPSADPDQFTLRPVTGLVVDTKHGNDDIVYVSYRLQYQNQPNGSARPIEPYVGVSRDGGKTFEKFSAIDGAFDTPEVRNRNLTAQTTIPGTTTTTVPAGTFGATPDRKENFGASSNGHGLTIDGKGNIYLAWLSQTQNGVTQGQPRGLFISKSTDQGRTWTVSQIEPFSYENRQNPRLVWSPKGGAQGSLHIAWEMAPGESQNVNSYADVMYIRSTDGGATWSQPKRLADDDPKQLFGKYLPNLSVAPNGRVDAVWWDTRDDPGIRANDVYYAYSDDGGVTWSKNIRMTDQTIDRRFGVWGNNFDQNSPPSLASVNEYAIVGWDDTRFSRGQDGPVLAADPVAAGEGVGGGVQDIFVSTVQFKAVGGGTSTVAKGVLAGVVGLLVVGLALVVAAMASRRRAGGAAPSKRSTTGAPAQVK